MFLRDVMAASSCGYRPGTHKQILARTCTRPQGAAAGCSRPSACRPFADCQALPLRPPPHCRSPQAAAATAALSNPALSIMRAADHAHVHRCLGHIDSNEPHGQGERLQAAMTWGN